MLSEKFNLLELLDLSLRVPEVGAVNFNILHTVLAKIIIELQLDHLRPPCNIHNEVAAQADITKSRLEDPLTKSGEHLRSTEDLKDIKNVLQVLDLEKSDVEETEKKESKKLEEGEESSEDADKQTLTGITSEDIFDTDPAKVVQEMWRAINVSRRLDSGEQNLKKFGEILDSVIDKLMDVERTIKESLSKFKELETFLERMEKLEARCEILENKMNETAMEVQRLEELIEKLVKELEVSNNALKELEASHQSLSERVAFKEDVDEIKNTVAKMNDEIKKLQNWIEQLEEATVRKEDFAELVKRVDILETDKVSREELGRLLEPGFIDNFIEEQQNLRTELDALKLTVANVEENLNSLITRIEEEILKDIHRDFEEIRALIAEMKEKLDTLDADDINDTFARLEEQADMIIKELESLQAAQARFEKEARANFKKISDVSALIKRLEETKADKSKMYELLELKADIELVMSKLDRSEFVSVMKDMEEKIERLTITVKINEEEMTDTFGIIKKELSFKMYTEDFIVGTEPIRNRIKAMIYEQKKIKEIALQNFFPDAPGVVKCISCKRAANLISLKCPLPIDKVKATNEKNETKEGKETTKSTKDKELKFPPIDVDEVPIPPTDKPRIQDIHQLPVLFANARPQIGLAHEKRKKDIDKEIAEYFSTGRLYAVGGEHTKTFPQQRGLTYTTMTLPQEKKTDVLLMGFDRRYYKGVVDETTTNEQRNQEEGTKHVDEKNKGIASAVVLQNAPVQHRQGTTVSVPNNKSKQDQNLDTGK